MQQSRTQLPEWLAGIDARCVAGIEPKLFDEVRATYNSLGRVYHAWPHILACIAEFREMAFENPRVVLLALLFHDAIYVAGRKDNEANSAALAIAKLSALSDVTLEDLDEVSRLILLTASHHAVGSPSPDAMKMLDIDLSILGADWPIYQEYSAGVRREFCPAVVSEFKFRIGRLKFLRSVQRQSTIFLTEEMRLRREAIARANIRREICELEHDIGMVGRILSRVA
jgi:predicted metal-dependent HD superfamily phosphohydrolase